MPGARAQQQGAIAMLMLLLVVLAAISVLLSQYDPSYYRSAQSRRTTDALAEAKQALIGWSVQDAHPGRLPCPDNIPKTVEGNADSNCSLPAVGRLPWRTLGLGRLVDGQEEPLWYAVSAGFRQSPINSETPAQLGMDGVPQAAVAIVFSPGKALAGQQRPSVNAGQPPMVSNYLDLVNADGDGAFISGPISATFNDRVLTITSRELFTVVERRVLGDARQCVDIYASGSHGKYPWAAPVSDMVDYKATPNVRFGRLPKQSLTPFSSDPGMLPSWSSVDNCVMYTTNSYWNKDKWQDLVFYQLSAAYQPNTVPPQACAGGCLSLETSGLAVDGSGSMRAMLVMAGAPLPGQARISSSDKKQVLNYLEASNNHVVMPSLLFTTYRVMDTSFANINDQAVCLDGGVQCR